MHQSSSTAGTIYGVLYPGDAGHKYQNPNSPTVECYTNVTPYDFALIDSLANREEASQMMLHQIDFDDDHKQLLPSLPSTSDLGKFRVSAERHAAYESLWRLLTFTGVVANTAVWLYI